MNHSIHSADRSDPPEDRGRGARGRNRGGRFGISARTNADYSQTAHVVKAGKPVVVTSSDTSLGPLGRTRQSICIR